MAIDSGWTHEQVVVNDVRLHCVTAGDEDDPLVVLLHGFPEFWYSWRRQIPALADAGFRVVAPDMRGYNRSEKPHGVGSYAVERLVGDVAGLVDHADCERAHVVGHDWGGVVAWETAIRRPEVVDRLAVLNAPHPARYRDVLRKNPDQRRRSLYAVYFQLSWLPELTLGALGARGVAAMLRATSNPGTFDATDRRRFRRAASRPGALTAMLNYYRALFREGVREEVRALVGGSRPDREVRAPTLLLWGEDDTALDVTLTEGLGEWVPDLRVERLPDATHWVQNDAPEAVNESLVAFLGE